MVISSFQFLENQLFKLLTGREHFHLHPQEKDVFQEIGEVCQTNAVLFCRDNDIGGGIGASSLDI